MTPCFDHNQRPSITYLGKIPQDWSAEEQQRLKSAIHEVAARMHIPAPGPREMPSIMSARGSGMHTDINQGLRYSRALNIVIYFSVAFQTPLKFPSPFSAIPPLSRLWERVAELLAPKTAEECIER